MIMGPIWRYSEAARQIKSRATEPVDIFYGCRRFVLGLSKKVLLADPLFRIYEQMETHGSWLSQWVGAFAFMLYIYMEFSGYADMACGMGRIFGFRLPENFKEPYTAISVSEFWRRWHCSLGMFFRDYIYIPLGGNRNGLPRQICNLLVVWILTGLWHGISWTFFLWGMYFFFLLTVEKLTGVLRTHRYVFIRRCLTLLLICFGWIIFSAPDLPTFGERVVKLFSFTTGGLRPTLVVLQSSLPLLILSAVLAIPGPVWNKQMDNKLRKSSLRTRKTVVVVQGVLILCLLVLCTVSLIGETARPSMYAGF
jgi:alginate O-acetyltransferase complex protein AlgI